MKNPVTAGMPSQMAVGCAIGAVGLLGVWYAGGRIEADVVIAFLIGGAGLSLGAGILTGRGTRQAIQTLRETIAVTRNDGDLARRAVVSESGAMGQVAIAYNELMASFQGIISRVLFNSNQVAGAADKLIAEARQTSESSTQQNAAAELAAEAVAEMASGVRKVAEQAGETTRIAQAAREHSAQGASIVHEASTEIERIARSVEESAQVVAALGERSEQISGIVKVIHDIADQTNLLALNAAIEAARAGEQGRGFAVVAGEVRNLAQRSAGAAREIKSLIAASVEKVDSGGRLVNAAGTTISELVTDVQRVNDIIGEISSAASGQSQELGNVNAAVIQLDQMTQQNAALVEQSAAAAESLREQSQRLVQLVAAFRVDGTAAATLTPSTAASLPPAAAPKRTAPAGRAAPSTHVPSTPKAAAGPATAPVAGSKPKPASPSAGPVTEPAAPVVPVATAAPALAGQDDWTTF